ncbi:MAG: alkaline phosphatase D family protein [Algicola sp.]|nr:alkaline phosphatase D family protein [Algicola sp.]
MSTVRVLKPTVGPIVGEATKNHLRIFIRGEDLFHDGFLSDTDYSETGICQIAEDAQFTTGLHTRVFKLHKQYDYTGVAIFGGLAASKTYYYRIGFGQGGFTDFYTSSFDWRDIATDQVRTHSDDPDQATSFLLGSCRYANRTLGAWFGDNQGDKTLRTAWQDAGGKAGEIDFTMFCGDQIYADDTQNFLWQEDKSVSDFQKKYRHMFNKKHFNKLCRNIPTYMILDDHEIEDNWPDTKNDSKLNRDSQQFVNAINYYQAYQVSHSPVFKVDSNAVDLDEVYFKDVNTSIKDKFGNVLIQRLSGTPKKFWYTFESGCMDVFVMDCRTERQLRHKNKYMISSVQMKALKDWFLTDKDYRVKAVVVSVPLFPDYNDGEDQWGDERLRRQRDEIVEFIDENKIPRALFLTGDIHVSYVSNITTKNSNTKIHQVISSPIYWPFPFGQGNEEDYTLNEPMQGNEKWEIKTPTKFIKDNNISRVDVNMNGFRVRVYEREGELLDDNRFTFAVS